MNQITLIRHIKSSWSNPLLKDFDRPIKKNRKIDLEKVVDSIKVSVELPQLILVSPAKRTRQTLKTLQKCFKGELDSTQIIFRNELYECSSTDLAKVLSEYNEGYDKIWVVGHNPGLTDFINQYLSFPLDNLPTSGWITFNVNQSTAPALKRFPKEL